MPERRSRLKVMQTSANYPLAVVIGYGPDHRTATKMVASIFSKPGQQEPHAQQKWTVNGGDIRQDAAVMSDLAAFLKRHYAAGNVSYNWVAGCPHEEGIDYPDGAVCPQCPFWANLDRFTLEPKSPDLPLSAEQILAALSRDRDTQPELTFTAVERNRERMIEPFLRLIERVLGNPKAAPPDESQLFSYAVAFLGLWREPRLFPLLIRWLSLPGEEAFDLGGDTVSEWGARLLAGICGNDLEPIKQLILNRQANEFCRSEGITALSLLVASDPSRQAEMADYFGWLAREGLEREPGYVWDALVIAATEIEATGVLDELSRAAGEDLFDPLFLEEELELLRETPRGETFTRFRESQQPFDDVATETAWWNCFSRNHPDPPLGLPRFDNELDPGFPLDSEPWTAPQPYIAPPKIGRNEPCPCGSGKKYKKCCGQ